MQSLGVMREFKTANCRVIVDALPEDDLDLSWDDDGSIRKGLESGRFIAFGARVRVFVNGQELGTDYLGGCVYKDFADFMDHRACGKQNRKLAKQGKEGSCGSYFHQMISEAITEARKNRAQLCAIPLRNAA